jgi:hypothetical protein
MLGIILISCTFIVAAFIHVLYSRGIKFFRYSPAFLIVVIYMTGAGIVLIIWQQRLISEDFARHAWPTTEATVTQTEITGERAFNPEIICRYEIDGQVYLLASDLHTPAFGRKRTRKQTAEIILREYPLGSHVLIHYNPDQPDQAYIKTGPFWNNYVILMFGLLMLTGGFTGLLNRLWSAESAKKNK